jgi:DnaJ-class molecular chaperone
MPEPEGQGPFRFTYARPEYDPHRNDRETAGENNKNNGKDFYGLLKVSREAKQDEIKRAYRKLAREMHPDVNPDLETQERFKEVTQAYDVLSDIDRRRTYDLGRSPAEAFSSDPPPPRPDMKDQKVFQTWLKEYGAWVERQKQRADNATGQGHSEPGSDNTSTKDPRPHGGRFFRKRKAG